MIHPPAVSGEPALPVRQGSLLQHVPGRSVRWLAIAGDLDEIPVRIADVDRAHGPSCPGLLDRSKLDLDPVRRKVLNNFFNLVAAQEAHIARSGRWDVCVWEVLRSERVQIDLLRAKVKGVELVLKHDMPHPQDALVELDSPGHVAYSEDQVVDALNFQDGVPWCDCGLGPG